MDGERNEPGRGDQPAGRGTPFPTRFGHDRRRRPQPLRPLGRSDAGERTPGGERRTGESDEPGEAARPSAHG